MLSMWRSGMAGSIGSDFTGVDGGGVCERVDVLGRESERECERALEHSTMDAIAFCASEDPAANARREFASSVVRN